MKRSIFCGLLAAMLMSTPAQAAQIEQAERAERSVIVQVDGHWLDSRGVVRDGVTYVPLGTLLDALGDWTLTWDAGTATAVAVSGDRTLIADPAADTVTLDGTSHSAGVSVEQGRTMVPLRLVSELLGATVEWDPYLSGAAVTSPDAAYNAVDYYWLSRIISAESQGEPLEGQIAVGNVVLNRVASDQFPDSIAGVVFDQKYAVQFEPVENGTVYNHPYHLSLEAAERVLDGETTVDGALYFYAPDLSPGTWINANRTYLATIGCHRFYL